MEWLVTNTYDRDLKPEFEHVLFHDNVQSSSQIGKPRQAIDSHKNEKQVILAQRPCVVTQEVLDCESRYKTSLESFQTVTHKSQGCDSQFELIPNSNPCLQDSCAMLYACTAHSRLACARAISHWSRKANFIMIYVLCCTHVQHILAWLSTKKSDQYE